MRNRHLSIRPSGKQILSILLCALTLLALIAPVGARAQSSRTVTVGYVWSTNFSEGEQDGEYKSGYAYEYLQKIAYYTGWEYKYVYGDWSTIFQMLMDGRVDVMAGVSLTPERRNAMDFPDYPMGTENYYIYVWQNSELANLTASEIRDLTVGCTEDSMQNHYLEDWNRSTGNRCTIQTYSGNIALYHAFSSHQVDAVVDTDNAILPTDKLVPLAKVGSSDYYLAVRKGADILLSQLNTAIEAINHSDPYYLQNLHRKYFSETAVGTTLTPSEKEWLRQHPVIRVGYLNAYLPYCGTDENGQATGVLVDIFENIFRNLTMDFPPAVVYKGFDDQHDLLSAAIDGSVDVVFPICGDTWFSEEMGLYQTSDVAQVMLKLVFKGNYSDLRFRKIGVNRNNLIQYQDTMRRYPDAEIVFYDSMDACLDGIVLGEIDCTITNSLRTDALTRRNIFNSLNSVELSELFVMCMGVKRGNTELLTLLNHGLSTLNKNFVLSSTYKYQQTLYVYTAKDFILENIPWVITGIVLIAGLLIWFLVRDSRKTREYLAQQKKLTRNLEDALEDAQCANRAKTMFLNNMSHDIRTPMNAIIGFTDIAKKQTQDEAIRACLDKISTSSEHLLTLINDVLDISRVESGKIVYSPAPTDLCQLTDVVLDIIQGFLTDRKLTFRVHRPDVKQRMVLTDPLRLREILVNILGNAIKFTDDSGSVDFTMDLCPGKDARHGIVRFTISDTGIGMSEEFQAHIFEEFSQEETSARTQYQGSGLGMAITKRYVDLMGGSITVSSKKGAGSTFTVELPMEFLEESPVVPQTSTPRRLLSGIRILLAEDNDLNAEIATLLLEESGMQVTRAQDGKEALSYFAHNPKGTYDVILMDIMMPVMNGNEATRAIRNLPDRPDGKTIPIIAVTANAFAEDVQASMEAGMNAHLAKPIVMDEVLKTISDLLP